jgi:hypothetical protein
MSFIFQLNAAEWDTRSSFCEHQNERPGERRKLQVWLGQTFQVDDADDLDDACQQLIDVINEVTGSMFHNAQVQFLGNASKKNISKEFVQEMKLSAQSSQRVRTEWGKNFITHRRQLLQVVL